MSATSTTKSFQAKTKFLLEISISCEVKFINSKEIIDNILNTIDTYRMRAHTHAHICPWVLSSWLMTTIINGIGEMFITDGVFRPN